MKELVILEMIDIKNLIKKQYKIISDLYSGHSKDLIVMIDDLEKKNKALEKEIHNMKIQSSIETDIIKSQHDLELQKQDFELQKQEFELQNQEFELQKRTRNHKSKIFNYINRILNYKK